MWLWVKKNTKNVLRMCSEPTSTLGALEDELANELTEGEKGEQKMLSGKLQLVKLGIQNAM